MSLDPKLQEAIEKLDAQIQTRFKTYEMQVEKEGAAGKKIAADLKVMTEEHAQLMQKVNALQDNLVQLEQQNHKLESQAPKPYKSPGQEFIESEAFKLMQQTHGKQPASHEFQMNTILGETGSPGEPTDDIVAKQYYPGIVPYAYRPLRVFDTVLKGTVTSNTIHFTRETQPTINAAETSEGADKPESDLVYTGVDSPVRTIAHTVKVSKQVLDDAPQLASHIDRRMRHGVLLRFENQIVAGNGTAPNLSGITDTGNFTALTVVTADNDYDAANRAREQIETADYMPSHVIINPADWGRLERTKTGISGDNTYLGGTGGAVNYVANGMQPILWGLPVVKSNAMTAGTFITLSIDALMLFLRQGVVVEMFEQDADNVKKNLITVRAEARGALAIFRPDAIIVGAWPNA